MDITCYDRETDAERATEDASVKALVRIHAWNVDDLESPAEVAYRLVLGHRVRTERNYYLIA